MLPAYLEFANVAPTTPASVTFVAGTAVASAMTWKRRPRRPGLRSFRVSRHCLRSLQWAELAPRTGVVLSLHVRRRMLAYNDIPRLCAAERADAWGGAERM